MQKCTDHEVGRGETEVGVRCLQGLVEEVHSLRARHVHPAEELVSLRVGSRGETVQLEAAELLEDLHPRDKVEGYVVAMEVPAPLVRELYQTVVSAPPDRFHRDASAPQSERHLHDHGLQPNVPAATAHYGRHGLVVGVVGNLGALELAQYLRIGPGLVDRGQLPPGGALQPLLRRESSGSESSFTPS